MFENVSLANTGTPRHIEQMMASASCRSCAGCRLFFRFGVRKPLPTAFRTCFKSYMFNHGTCCAATAQANASALQRCRMHCGGRWRQQRRRHSMQLLVGPADGEFCVPRPAVGAQGAEKLLRPTETLGRVMAPLFLSVAQLQHTFCPLSTRGSHLAHLQGSQARSVPCTRLSRAVSRQQTVVRAVSEAEVMSNGTTNGDGASIEPDRLAGTRPSTKTVHGGERAGRPRVSGGQCAVEVCLQIGSCQLPPAAAPAAASAAAVCRRKQEFCSFGLPMD